MTGDYHCLLAKLKWNLKRRQKEIHAVYWWLVNYGPGPYDRSIVDYVIKIQVITKLNTSFWASHSIVGYSEFCERGLLGSTLWDQILISSFLWGKLYQTVKQNRKVFWEIFKILDRSAISFWLARTNCQYWNAANREVELPRVSKLTNTKRQIANIKQINCD